MPKPLSELNCVQKAQYFASNLVLRGVINLMGTLPYGMRVRMMGGLVRTLAPVLGISKRIKRNLSYISPEMPDRDVARTCGEVADNAGRTLAELYAGEPFWKRAQAAEISGHGLDALSTAKAEGRPVILVTAHFGNYEAARVKLIDMGFAMGSLYRRMANPYFNKHYVETIQATGKPMFEQGKRGMVEMVRYLKQGGTLAVVTDLHAIGGAEIDFFGKPAKTSLVTAELALKYNAMMIPVYAIRQENGLDFQIIMKEPIPHTDALTMTTAVTKDLEELVRTHMGQWFWIHRRWKPYHDQPAPPAG
ncbi:lysophospholipid acyltransferase family protein [Epibacterium ulvae]|uniref:lysophospholipid acyltransferase family protein n=1 Tax=Epibacterium ulvae TaxID=1156985 RepID=UPI001BFC375E|nr:lysophospholipid acyltransferase family protein [Epibacterium ulvae]MBT8155401.1 lysophospholipid acyltransferase family protein [Epibacterium ulvae]